jgi:hypothetical protein
LLTAKVHYRVLRFFKRDQKPLLVLCQRRFGARLAWWIRARTRPKSSFVVFRSASSLSNQNL